MYVGEKMRNSTKLPKGKMHMQGRLGRKWWNRKTPQPEAFWKQAGWVESGGKGKTPQPEAFEKQAGWGESSGKGKTLQ